MEQIVKLLREHSRFVIAGHIGPDEDTIGSCLGLAMALGKLGKDAAVVLEPCAAKHHIIPGQEYLYRGDGPLLPEVFIAIDCADIERLGPAQAFFNKANITVCIDHHETNKGFAEYNYIDPAASSTAEMVYGIIEILTDIDTDIATAIYAGIVTDTDGFRHVSTGSSTMAIAGRLMDTGIPFTDIYSELLHRHSFAAAKAFGMALEVCRQTMDGRIVYAYITREMLASAQAESSEMDSVVNYLMNTRGAEVALFLYERHQNAKNVTDDTLANSCEASSVSKPDDGLKKIKVSMRSRKLHVGQIAASLGGGGHRLAAGCTMVGAMDDVLRQVLEAVERELKVEGPVEHVLKSR